MKFKNTKKLINFINKFSNNADYFISGGCLIDIENNEEPKDIDIYFRAEGDYLIFLNNLNKLKEETQEEEINPKSSNSIKVYRIASTDNAETFLTRVRGKGLFNEEMQCTFQLIKRSFKEPLETLNEFDLNVCQRYLTKDNVIHESPKYHKTDLKINEDRNLSVHTLFRLMKYKDKGFKLSAEYLSEIIEKITTLHLLENYYDKGENQTPFENISEFLYFYVSHRTFEINDVNLNLIKFIFEKLKEINPINPSFGEIVKHNAVILNRLYLWSITPENEEAKNFFNELYKDTEFFLCTYLSMIRHHISEESEVKTIFKKFDSLREIYPEYFL